MTNTTRHPVEKRDPYDLSSLSHGSRIALRLSGMTIMVLLTLCLSLPAYAEDKKEAAETETAEEVKTTEEAKETEEPEEEEEEDPTTRYAPDICDFEITFPDEPYTSKRCPQGVGKCYELTGYTMVYDLSTTVDVSVTCVPSTPANYQRYNERVIKAALNGMVGRAGITDFSINTQETENTRQGSLIGTGNYGKQKRIYNAQLWIGQNSVFTMEAKLIGRKHHEADTVFSEILKSIKKKQEE